MPRTPKIVYSSAAGIRGIKKAPKTKLCLPSFGEAVVF